MDIINCVATRYTIELGAYSRSIAAKNTGSLSPCVHRCVLSCDGI